MSDEETTVVLWAVQTLGWRECFLRLGLGYQQYAKLKQIADICLKRKP